MNVTIYTTSTCPWCEKTKEFFKDNNVKFKEINVQEDQEKSKEMVEKSGQMGVPVIDIDGEIIVGFDVEKLKAALKL